MIFKRKVTSISWSFFMCSYTVLCILLSRMAHSSKIIQVDFSSYSIKDISFNKFQSDKLRDYNYIDRQNCKHIVT